MVERKEKGGRKKRRGESLQESSEGWGWGGGRCEGVESLRQKAMLFFEDDGSKLLQ